MKSLQDWMHRLFVVNGTLKLLAFILTLALFIWVREDRESAVTGFAPLRMVIPEKHVLVSEPVERVRITVGGRWSDLNKFDPSQMTPITLEIDDSSDGLVSITADMIRLPPGLRVNAIQPSYVRVKLEPEGQRAIKLRPRIIGEPAESFELGEVTVKPARIEVTGPKTSLEGLEYMWTEPIDVTDRVESFDKRVQLRVEDPLIQYDVNRLITVTVPITTQEVVRTLQAVPVVTVNTTLNATVNPKTVTVTLRGPKPIVDRMAPDSIHASIDLAAENEKGPGTFSKPARIANLPPEVNLVTFHPNDFVVTTSAREGVEPPRPAPIKESPDNEPQKPAPREERPEPKPRAP